MRIWELPKSYLLYPIYCATVPGVGRREMDDRRWEIGLF